VTTRKIARDYLGKVEARLDALRLFLAPARLFEERGHAFYGDEDDLVPPSELFERSEAEEAIGAVERLLGLYRLLLDTAKD